MNSEPATKEPEHDASDQELSIHPSKQYSSSGKRQQPNGMNGPTDEEAEQARSKADGPAHSVHGDTVSGIRPCRPLAQPTPLAGLLTAVPLPACRPPADERLQNSFSSLVSAIAGGVSE
jgi:hypothetical protein